jgi:hypothetical protein
MAEYPVAFAGTEDLIEWLRGRAERSMTQGSAGMRAKTEIGMWRSVLVTELQRQRWTLAELGLLADCHNGTIITDGIAINIGIVAAGVIDCFQMDPGMYGQHHGLDEDEMTKKLLPIGPAADHALADAIARWWSTQAEHTPEGWASVGIKVHEDKP